MRLIGKFFIGLICLSSTVFAQNKNSTANTYIEKYKDLAIQEMLLTGIPASITLAQGMHESANGTSQLARNANNHFGVKCGSTWTGKRYYRNGNKRNSCFRKYNTVEEAFKDRSRFLSNNKNYAKLFTYKKTDYKKWAYGLQRAGYAASRYYAAHLIRTIEQNNLQRFDQIDSLGHDALSAQADSTIIDTQKTQVLNKVVINKEPRVHIVKKGESLSTIALKYKTSTIKIKKANKLKSNLIKPKQKLIIP